MTAIPIITADDRDIDRCRVIASLVQALENANRAITQLVSVWPDEMRASAQDIVRSGESLVRFAREEIQ